MHNHNKNWKYGKRLKPYKARLTVRSRKKCRKQIKKILWWWLLSGYKSFLSVRSYLMIAFKVFKIQTMKSWWVVARLVWLVYTHFVEIKDYCSPTNHHHITIMMMIFCCCKILWWCVLCYRKKTLYSSQVLGHHHPSQQPNL